jgi:hypothetical protein
MAISFFVFIAYFGGIFETLGESAAALCVTPLHSYYLTNHNPLSTRTHAKEGKGVPGSKWSYLGHNRAIYTRGALKDIIDMDRE